MSESDTASVDCPLCGEAFDPTAAGGWCTNSDCGEWQHEVDVTPDQGTTEGDRSPDESGTDGSGTDESADLDEPDEPPATGEPTASAESDGAASAAVGGDDGNEEDSSDDGDEEGDSDDASMEAEKTAADEQPMFDCPGCGSSLTAEANFCPDCGEDVADLPAANDAADLEDCPGCGGEVDPSDNFCPDCGEDLDAHRGPPEPLDACPDCGTDVDEGDSFCAGCGTDLDAHRAGEAVDADGQLQAETASASQSAETTETGEPAPDALALTAHGKSVVVGDGDTVGREIRSLLTDAGQPEDEAVRVHREHLRFVREADQFYVVALGQNPTVLNGRSLAKGDRERVRPGDELELSDVVTLGVEAV